MYEPHFQDDRDYSPEAQELIEKIVVGPQDMPEDWQETMAKYVSRLNPEEINEFCVLMADLQTAGIQRVLDTVLKDKVYA